MWKEVVINNSINVIDTNQKVRFDQVSCSRNDCFRHSREKGFFYEASKGKAVDEELGRQV